MQREPLVLWVWEVLLNGSNSIRGNHRYTAVDDIRNANCSRTPTATRRHLRQRSRLTDALRLDANLRLRLPLRVEVEATLLWALVRRAANLLNRTSSRANGGARRKDGRLTYGRRCFAELGVIPRPSGL